MKKLDNSLIFITLGIVWGVVGFFIYSNSSVWTLGLLFLVVGLILRLGRFNEAQ